jgi:UDP-N-acetyl-D-mannosaminuronate dehydrogenase
VITDHKSVDYQRVVDRTPLVIDARNVTAKLKPGRARLVTLTSSRPEGAVVQHA